MRDRSSEPTTRFFVLGPILVGFVVLAAFLGKEVLWSNSQGMGPAFTHGHRRSALVALTFDDGPNEPYTGQILDILKARGVKATFFVIGENAERFPDAVRREIAEGMEVGNHTMNHPYLIKERKREMFWQISETQDLLREITGVTPKWFRPPHGFRDPRVFRVTERLDLNVVEWSNMPRDWTRPGTDVIVSRVLNHLKGGDIILLHDGANLTPGGDRSQTVAALPLILDGIEARGLRPVTLSQLAATGGRGLRRYWKMEELRQESSETDEARGRR
jgi:peptidoglycan/xylan/chitin deacetylase (PgdA/CDA1 family)